MSKVRIVAVDDKFAIETQYKPRTHYKRGDFLYDSYQEAELIIAETIKLEKQFYDLYNSMTDDEFLNA